MDGATSITQLLKGSEAALYHQLLCDTVRPLPISENRLFKTFIGPLPKVWGYFQIASVPRLLPDFAAPTTFISSVREEFCATLESKYLHLRREFLATPLLADEADSRLLRAFKVTAAPPCMLPPLRLKRATVRPLTAHIQATVTWALAADDDVILAQEFRISIKPAQLRRLEGLNWYILKAFESEWCRAQTHLLAIV